MPFIYLSLYRYSCDLEGGAFFNKYQNLGDSGENIIYISQRLMNSLNAAREIMCDATFKVVPKHPKKLQQILTIHIMFMDKVCIRKTFIL